MRHVQVRTTVESRADADRLAHVLVGERLAACVQVLGPVHSTYCWQDAVQSAQEWLCVAKTTADRFDELASRVRQLHGYQVPEIVALPVEAGDAAHLQWVEAEVANRPGDGGAAASRG